MAYQLFSVVLFGDSEFAAFPVVNGEAQYPREPADALGKGALVLGNYLENVISGEWVLRGHKLLSTSAKIEIESAKQAFNDMAKSREEAAKKDDDNAPDAKPVETSTETVTEVIKPKPTKKK